MPSLRAAVWGPELFTNLICEMKQNERVLPVAGSKLKNLLLLDLPGETSLRGDDALAEVGDDGHPPILLQT